MPAVQPHPLNAAASDAAGSGNFPAAAALLRQLLESQTSLLGPDHPELATTLNNLALMLERSGDTAEAGRCYRRALALATLAHGPEAANVRVSQANLAAFYREFGSDGDDDLRVAGGGLDDFAPVSRPGPGRPPVPARARATAVAPAGRASESLVEDGPVPPSRKTPRLAVEAAAPAAHRGATRPWRNPHDVSGVKVAPEVRLPIFAARPAPTPRRAPDMQPGFIPPDAPASSWRRITGSVMILALGIALAGVPAWWIWGPAAGEAPADETGPVNNAAAAPAGQHVMPETDVAGPATASAALPAVADIEASDTFPDAPRDEPGASPLRVAEAGLCAELAIGQGPWRCEPTRDRARGDSVYYYTRVATPRDDLIRHRWTRDGRLVQMVVLRILRNPGEGYRTFSRQSGPLLEAGTWQVALLAPDGRVLDETEFTVR